MGGDTRGSLLLNLLELWVEVIKAHSFVFSMESLLLFGECHPFGSIQGNCSMTCIRLAFSCGPTSTSHERLHHLAGILPEESDC